MKRKKWVFHCCINMKSIKNRETGERDKEKVPTTECHEFIWRVPLNI